MKAKLILLVFFLSSLISFGQVEVEELKQFNEKMTEIETRFDVKQTELLREIEKLNSELESLSSNQLTKRIEALEKKQQNVELLKINEQDKEIQLYMTKYQAGVLIIKDIIESLEKLKSQYDAVSFNDSYKDLSNPNQYPQFTQNLDFLKEKLVKKGLTLPELNLGNPILNTVYAVTKGIVSDQSNKDDKISELYCILDFTSQASQELNIVKYDLIYLQYSIDKMLIDYNNLFKSYTLQVGYDKNFKTYITDPNENLSEKIEVFFEEVNKKESTNKEKDIKSTKFQLKKVMDAYIKYEMFISQNTAYYEKFELIIDNLSPTCADANTNAQILSKYDIVKDKLKSAKESFTAAFSGTIKQSYLRELIE